MKKIIAGMLMLLQTASAHAFCGFYVAKADTKIFNQASQVIMVHDGTRNIITMSNDFKGNVKDFAMVVPVPVVLANKDIRVRNQQLFAKLDAYSAPRLVEYFDENPCEPQYRMYKNVPMAAMADMASVKEEKVSAKKLGVRIEARYAVGEYDILILSAKQSNGLKIWLNENGYKIPEGANEVLDPYIRSNMKFFVAKVNVNRHNESGFQALNPIQIEFNSPKFMLPIRLGMANSSGQQDLIIYTLSTRGRIECTNYRTVKMPTGQNMPEFIQNEFGKFYGDVFRRAWLREGQSAVFQEYAWDVSPTNFMKCDPCVAEAPDYNDLREAGVDWMDGNYNAPYNENGNKGVFFTRLHVRYDREHFAQDLVFQETPDKRNWQTRYVLHHPAAGSFNCEAGAQYVNNTIDRRRNELKQLQQFAGWSATRYPNYPYTWEGQQYRKLRQGSWSLNWPLMLLFVGLQVSVIGFILARKKRTVH